MSFASFMRLALYHPTLGYYRRERPRVGYAAGTDFFTASTSGPLFGELVAAAAARLLRDAGRVPAEHAFIEVGAEPGGDGILSGVAHPFASVRTVRVGEALSVSGRCVVFSNELFDAQPFVRAVFRDGRWREVGVTWREGAFHEVELETAPPHTPPGRGEGYRFDQPVAATDLAREIAAQPWTGLFLAFDYGKTWRELTEETPGGTARAYYRHTQSNDLLARPGEQDLTCHVCWDWLSDALREDGFAEPQLAFQETFFVRNAGEFIAATMAAEATQLSRRKLGLMQLLHPAQLGQKFQVLSAVR